MILVDAPKIHQESVFIKLSLLDFNKKEEHLDTALVASWKGKVGGGLL